MWTGLCEALSCDPSAGMTLADFGRMYDMSGGDNDLGLDYMRLCEGLTITSSAGPVDRDTLLIVRVTGTEPSADGKDTLYVVQVTEEEDDYAVSINKYRYKDFQRFRKKLVALFPEIKNLEFTKRLETLDSWMSSCFQHPEARRSQLLCDFLSIDRAEQEIEIDFEGKEGEESRMMQTLSHIYNKIVEGVPGMQNAMEMGDEYKHQVKGPLRDRADALIRAQNMKAGAQGFVTSLGGLPFLPATIPANIIALLYVWIRMSAAIAHIGGHDVATEETKALVFLTILGGDAPDLTQIASNEKLVQVIIKRILFAFGRKSAGNVARKAVPIVAGFANAACKCLPSYAKYLTLLLCTTCVLLVPWKQILSHTPLNCRRCPVDQQHR